MSVAAGDSSRNGSSVGDWLRNSVARSSFGRRAAAAATNVAAATAAVAASGWAGVGAELDHVDPAAAYHTFTKHWQQTVEIMDRTATRREVFQDDVTAVINHLRQMITLLQVDIRQIMTKDRPPSETRSSPDNTSEAGNGVPDATRDPISASAERGSKKPYTLPSSGAPLDPLPTPIFDHFLGEEILDKVLEWSLGTGEFANSLKLEQLRIHEVLLSQSRQELLVYKPVIRPLIRLLDSCLTCVPVEVERHLVLLLNQLCASLLHNQQLLHFFFLSSPNEQGDAKFLIFSLLLPFVHREGDLGQQARDALLLCMALSNTNPPVGQYIADTSNFCPLLAAGMCGLYSTLPRTLPSSVAGGDDWHCISAADVPHIPNLKAFLNALEFCNAVVQVGHPVVRNELVELVYQGFLVLVLGPALHQVNIEEVVTATAYVDLFLSYATEPQLRRAFLAFLLTPPPRHCEDEQLRTETAGREPPIITTLISRIHSDNSRVCLVTLQLFVRIVDCWCEDAMLVLMLQYLVSGSHVMVSHRHSTTQHAPTHDAHKLLDLVPSVLKHEEECRMCGDAAGSCEGSSCDQMPYTRVLQEARDRICRVAEACSKWTWRYDGVSPSPAQAVAMLQAAKAIQPLPYPKPRSESDPTQSSSSDPAYNPLIVGVSTEQRRSSLPSSTNVVLKTPVLVTVSTSVNTVSVDTVSSSSVGVNTVSVDTVSSSNSGTHNTLTTITAPGSVKSCRSVSRRGGALPHPTILNLSHDDDQPESLGESSGYESFNFRTSRDSSPSSLPGSPRAPHRTKPATSSSSSPDTGATDVDDEFLEELMAWDVSGDSCQNSLSQITSSLSDGRSSDLRNAASESDQCLSMRNRDAEELEETMRKIDEAHAVYAPASPVHTTSQDSDCDDVNWDEPDWSSPPSPPSSPLPPHARPTIGPFLEAVLERVEDVLNLSIPVTQLLFALLLRLASCPAPILTTLLLHPSILCQPAVRSLYQVLGSAKQRIDACLTEDDAHLLAEARAWFSAKQQRQHPTAESGVQMIAHHHHQTTTSAPQRPAPPPPPPLDSLAPPDPSKDGGRKWSLTASVSGAVGALFKRGSATPQQQLQRQQPMLQFLPDNAGFRYYRQPSDGSTVSTSPPPSLHTDSTPPTSLTSTNTGTPPSAQSVFYAPTLPESSSSLPLPYGAEACDVAPSSQSLGSVLYSTEAGTSTVETSHRRAVHSYNPQKVHAARCAILLRQLLLNLSALAQEHAVYSPQMVFEFIPKNSTSGGGGGGGNDISGRKSSSLERRTLDS